MAIYFVSFPIKFMVIFHGKELVYQRVNRSIKNGDILGYDGYFMIILMN